MKICKELLRNPQDYHFYRRVVKWAEKFIYLFNPSKSNQWLSRGQSAEPVIKRKSSLHFVGSRRCSPHQTCTRKSDDKLRSILKTIRLYVHSLKRKISNISQQNILGFIILAKLDRNWMNSMDIIATTFDLPPRHGAIRFSPFQINGTLFILVHLS